MYFPNTFDPPHPRVHPRSTVVTSAGHGHAVRASLRTYRAGMLAEFRHESEAFRRLIRLAVNEAEGLACSTPYAHLLLPALVEEKIRSVRRWASHQHGVSPGLHPASIATNPGKYSGS